MGIESKFSNRLRITDRETRDAAIMVFAGLLNKKLALAVSLAEGNQPWASAQATRPAFWAEPHAS